MQAKCATAAMALSVPPKTKTNVPGVGMGDLRPNARVQLRRSEAEDTNRRGLLDANEEPCKLTSRGLMQVSTNCL